jgi:hypothetical protein
MTPPTTKFAHLEKQVNSQPNLTEGACDYNIHVLGP